MPDHHLLGPYVRRFLLEHVVADRNLSRNTQCSYRDVIRLLLRFMTDRHRIDPADLAVEHVTAEIVRDFLMYLKEERSYRFLMALARWARRRLPAQRSRARVLAEADKGPSPAPGDDR